METTFNIEGNIVDVVNQRIFKGYIFVANGIIEHIEENQFVNSEQYILPGFIDAHIHIESSMLIPSAFAATAVRHGTVACVCDPHEIANVLGIEGIRFMIENGNKVPFKFFFGVPSCVPATSFETAGASITPEDMEYMFQHWKLPFMAEMMNFPGVINQDAIISRILAVAKKFNVSIDGHAPGVSGEGLKKYANSGISTDHECVDIDEAIEKINNGMKILIREGSAAKNFNALLPLLNQYADKAMFCSDDKHPDDLSNGHINVLVSEALAKGYDLMKVLQASSLNPIKHYKLNVGLLQKGDAADFIISEDRNITKIKATCINGHWVYKDNVSNIPFVNEDPINNFNIHKIDSSAIALIPKSNKIKVIKAYDGSLLTDVLTYEIIKLHDNFESCIEDDILKLVVLNRYHAAAPAISYIHGFGLKQGAIASSIAHDSHNVIAVGVSDKHLEEAINLVIENKGGIAYVSKEEKMHIALPFAGLMTNNDAFVIGNKYQMINKKLKNAGCKLQSPFMTLSFMALLVIPALKLSDKGLFDGNKFAFTSLFD